MDMVDLHADIAYYIILKPNKVGLLRVCTILRYDHNYLPEYIFAFTFSLTSL